MNTTLHVTIDRQTKQKAQKLARELGLDLSTVVKASLKTFVQTETFHIEKSDTITPYLAAMIAQAKKELAQGKAYGPFGSKELDEFLAS